MSYSRFILHNCLLLAVISNQAKMEVARFEAAYRSAKTLRATFLERYSENGNLVRAEAGVAYFRRPGKMRWEYESPERNLFLVDGKTAWFYVPADHTVTRVPAKQSGDWRTPLALLAGEAKVSRICRDVEIAEKEQPSDPKHVLLRCELRGAERANTGGRGKPGSDSALSGQGPEREVLFEIDRQSGELARVVVRERAGVTVEFQFRNWQVDPPVADSLFRFAVPPGVAIVQAESPAPNAGRNQ